MDERNGAGGFSRPPNEIVETYRRPLTRRIPGERVLTYRRPSAPVPAPTGPERAAPEESGGKRPRRRRRRGLWLFLACFAAVALLAGVSMLLEGRSSQILEDPFEQPYEGEAVHENSGVITIPACPAGAGALVALQLDHGDALTAQEVYQTVNPAVVMVMAQLEDGVSLGTGVIISGDGYLITNYHVLEGGSECMVVLDTGVQYRALYVGGDQDHDLAVLKMEGADGLLSAEFGDSDLLTVGDPVFAIGNPLGVELRGTLTDGLVSAIDRDIQVDDRVMTLIQTNAALNSGNSGGPLINQYGQVIGINVVKMTSEYSNVEGLGFAIPSTAVERIVNDILTFGEAQPEPQLGVTVLREGVEVEPGLWGLEVLEVSRDSAAARAGVREGDYLLTAAGEELRGSRDLMRVRRHSYVGDQLPITLWRDGERVEVVLDLQEEL